MFEMFVNFGAAQWDDFKQQFIKKWQTLHERTRKHESKLRYLMPNINIIKYVFNSAGKLR